MTPLEIALEHIGIRLAVIPIPYREKKPVIEGWPDLRITAETAPRYFNGGPQNIGALWGEPSGGATDVDLDCEEARIAAPHFLPQTRCFGRKSAPRSHWIFITDLDATDDRGRIALCDTDKTSILELRIGKGHQTVLPGSMHKETGELIEWADAREFTRIDGAELKALFHHLASCTLLARHFPPEGGRHQAALVVGGFLTRCGLGAAVLASFAHAIAAGAWTIRGDRDAIRDTIAAIQSKARNGKDYGFPALADTFGKDVAEKVADWLGYQGERGERNPFDPGPNWQEKWKKKAPDGETILIKASEITPEPISWLWKYWLARGKLHIIAGAPGGGKTTIYLSFAAIISSGATWPDGTRAQAGNVLIWTSEDGHADTIIPRLTRMGADLGRIFIVRGQREANGKTRAFNPSTDVESLREKAATISGGIDFVFLDPVVSAVPVTRNPDKNAETRAGLTPFVDFAIELNAAAGGVTHVSKWTTGKEPLERVTGTLAYGAVPRIVLLTSVNKAEGDGEPERIMVRVKNNIGPCDGGFGFHIDTAPLLERPDIEATRIVWELPLEGTAIELMNAAEGETAKVSKLDEAKRFLHAALSKGERPQKELEAEALAQGITERTLKRASQDGEIGKRKGGFGSSGGWVWWLS